MYILLFFIAAFIAGAVLFHKAWKLFEHIETVIETAAVRFSADSASHFATYESVLKQAVDAHVRTLQEIMDSHGSAAQQLAVSTEAHAQAAEHTAGAAREINRAAAEVNIWLKASNMAVIADHLAALRKFYCPR